MRLYSTYPGQRALVVFIIVDGWQLVGVRHEDVAERVVRLNMPGKPLVAIKAPNYVFEQEDGNRQTESTHWHWHCHYYISRDEGRK